MCKKIVQNKPGKGATCGSSATLTGKPRVIRQLQAYYKQGGRWYKVGQIFGNKEAK